MTYFTGIKYHIDITIGLQHLMSVSCLPFCVNVFLTFFSFLASQDALEVMRVT